MENYEIKKIVKSLTEFQRSILTVMSDANENNYILEVFDINEVKTTFTLTNGEDDFKEIRTDTMKRICSLDFILSSILPSSDRILRTKHFVQKKYLADVYIACL